MCENGTSCTIAGRAFYGRPINEWHSLYPYKNTFQPYRQETDTGNIVCSKKKICVRRFFFSSQDSHSKVKKKTVLYLRLCAFAKGRTSFFAFFCCLWHATLQKSLVKTRLIFFYIDCLGVTIL